MIFVWFFLFAILLAAIVFLFGWFWYSKWLFGDVFIKNTNIDSLQRSFNIKKFFIIEFGANLLISLCVIFVFSPYNILFGLINGVIVSVGILLPFAISDSLWSCGDVKLFFVKFFHKMLSIVIYFVGSGLINQFIFPAIISS